jgi:hypothetical protein
VLLGDSVFDNQPYVARGAATTDSLVARLPASWNCTLLAQDGSVIDEVPRQLMHLPTDTTHLVVSTGGNDALSDAGILSEPVSSVGEGLWKLGQVVDRFERRYRDMLGKVKARRLPTIVCTIYNADFADADVQQVTTKALAVFNDAIIRAAWAAGLQVLDLRAVCDEPEDYCYEIEPSARGGQKIADAIVRVLGLTATAENRK